MAALPYERRSNESDPAWEAFVLYRDAGLDRSLAKVAQALGKSVQLIERWSSSTRKEGHDWRKRVIAYDMDVDRRKRIGDLKGIEDMRRRQTRLALLAQDLVSLELGKLVKGAKKHGDASTVDPGLVAKLLESATKLERVVRGEPGEIIETHTADSVDLSGIPLDDLKAMRRVRAVLAAKREATADGESDTVH